MSLVVVCGKLSIRQLELLINLLFFNQLLQSFYLF